MHPIFLAPTTHVSLLRAHDRNFGDWYPKAYGASRKSGIEFPCHVNDHLGSSRCHSEFVLSSHSTCIGSRKLRRKRADGFADDPLPQYEGIIVYRRPPCRHSRGRSGQAHKAALRVTERDCGDLRAICRRTGPASPGVAFQPGAFFLLFSATPPRFRVQAQAAPMASGRGVSLQRKRFITVEGRLPSVIQCWIGDAR